MAGQGAHTVRVDDVVGVAADAVAPVADAHVARLPPAGAPGVAQQPVPRPPPHQEHRMVAARAGSGEGDRKSSLILC